MNGSLEGSLQYLPLGGRSAFSSGHSDRVHKSKKKQKAKKKKRKKGVFFPIKSPQKNAPFIKKMSNRWTRVGAEYQVCETSIPDPVHFALTQSSESNELSEEAVTKFLSDACRLPHGFVGSEGAREEECLETLHACGFDAEAALDALRAPSYACLNRYAPPSATSVREPAYNERLAARETRLNVGAFGANVRAGDCVYLRSDTSALPYIALVEGVTADKVTCRWFYRYSDLPASARRSVGSSDLELFLSPVCDVNSVLAVAGLCHVSARPGDGTAHFCRSRYDPYATKIVATARVKDKQRQQQQRQQQQRQQQQRR